MLVLSRKEHERIVFPSLNISIQLTRLSGRIARVAIDAPEEIPILRGELVDEDTCDSYANEAREKRHDLRNKLNIAHMSLGLLQKRLKMDGEDVNQQLVQSTIDSLSDLESSASLHVAVDRAKSSSTLRALIVEDNANERELLTGYLTLSGYIVDAVSNGLAALEYLSTHQSPDFVLLDMQMPKMDGRETVMAIRQSDDLKELKVFALSGMEREAWNLPIGSRGIDQWFTKPVRPDALTRQLTKEVYNHN